MPKINVYLPDHLAEAVREAGVPVSLVCQRALDLIVRRVTAVESIGLGDLESTDGRLSQFTSRAVAAVRAGVARARTRGSATVDTGDILSGVLGTEGNFALQVLESMQLSPAHIASRLDEATAPASGAVTERLGEHAAAALRLTVVESVSLGHNFIDCAHLLLGLIAESEGTAGQLLRELGADLRATRNATVAAMAESPRHREGTGKVEPAAASVHQTIEELARRLERLERHVGLEP